jgi:hypothetical protein
MRSVTKYHPAALVGRVLGLAAALLLWTLAAAPAHGHPPHPSGDMTGVWTGWGDQTPPHYRSPSYPLKPPFTPEGEAMSRFYADPRNNLGSRCLPAGGPGGMMNPRSFFPMEIIHKENQVTIIFELMEKVRRIYIGKEHPRDLDKTWMGHSVAKWEGDTLVVHTIGVKGGVLNGAGAAVVPLAHDVEPRMPYSDAMELTERLRLLEGGNVLESRITLVDRKFYTQPLHFTRYWRRAPEVEMIEYVCAENMRPDLEGTPR